MPSDNDLEKDEVLNLGIALLEDFQDKKEETCEEFEWYTHVLKLRIHTKETNFCNRLVKGYEALLEELNRESH